MSTPTAAQIDALLNFLEEHRDLARGNLRSIEGRALSHRLWEEITNSLNAMGGCTKTTKQWQKVWIDKKYLTKKAAAAALRSASATGGGPSTAPSLSQWELKVTSIMGDGFGEPQTSARVPAFVEHATPEIAAASVQPSQDEDLIQLNDLMPVEIHSIELDTQAQPSQHTPATHNPITSTRQRRRYRQHSASLRTNSSVRDRLFAIEERRTECEERRNAELAGIRMAVTEMCRLMQQLIEQLQPRIQQ